MNRFIAVALMVFAGATARSTETPEALSAGCTQALPAAGMLLREPLRKFGARPPDVPAAPPSDQGPPCGGADRSDGRIFHHIRPPVHQWLVYQAKFAWSSPEIDSFLPPAWSDDVGDLDASPILLGLRMEDDEVSSDFAQCWGWHPYCNHFWDPTQGVDAGLEFGGRQWDSAYVRAEKLWNGMVLPLYREGRKREAYYWLGRVAHLLTDLSVPAHTHLDIHLLDAVEAYMAERSRGADYNFKQWAGGGHPIEASSLRDIFFSMAETANQFESNNVAGKSSAHPFRHAPALEDHDGIYSWHNVSYAEAHRHGEVIMPAAIRHVAGLYRLFWLSTGHALQAQRPLAAPADSTPPREPALVVLRPDMTPLGAGAPLGRPIGSVVLAERLDLHRDLAALRLGGRDWELSMAADSTYNIQYLAFRGAGTVKLQRIKNPRDLIGEGVVAEIEPGVHYRFRVQMNLIDPMRGSDFIASPVPPTAGPSHEIKTAVLLDRARERAFVFEEDGNEYWLFYATDADPAADVLGKTRSLFFVRMNEMDSKIWPVAESRLETGKPVTANLDGTSVVLLRSADGRLTLYSAGAAPSLASR